MIINVFEKYEFLSDAFLYGNDIASFAGYLNLNSVQEKYKDFIIFGVDKKFYSVALFNKEYIKNAYDSDGCFFEITASDNGFIYKYNYTYLKQICHCINNTNYIKTKCYDERDSITNYCFFIDVVDNIFIFYQGYVNYGFVIENKLFFKILENYIDRF